MVPTAPGQQTGTIKTMNSDDSDRPDVSAALEAVREALAAADASAAPRVWLLWDADSLISVHMREASALAAREAYAAVVQADLPGERWEQWFDAHVVVAWREVTN